MTKPLPDGEHFKLGLFSPNCSSGLAVTAAPDRWTGSWDDNLRMTKIADKVGIDFLLPIARWIGYGGDTNFHEGVLDPHTWAADCSPTPSGSSSSPRCTPSAATRTYTAQRPAAG